MGLNPDGACSECGLAWPDSREHKAKPRRCLLRKLASYAEAMGAEGSVCGVCATRRGSVDKLIAHLHSRYTCAIALRLKELSDFACPVCRTPYRRKAGLLSHIHQRPGCLAGLGVAGGTARSCDDCGLTLWSPGLLERHCQSRFGCELVNSGALTAKTLRKVTLKTSTNEAGAEPHDGTEGQRQGLQAEKARSAKDMTPDEAKQELESHSSCPEPGGPAGEPHRARPRKCLLAKLRSYAVALTGTESGACASCGFKKRYDHLSLVQHVHSRCGQEGGKPGRCEDCGLTLWSDALLQRHRQSRFGCLVVKSRLRQEQHTKKVSPATKEPHGNFGENRSLRTTAGHTERRLQKDQGPACQAEQTGGNKDTTQSEANLELEDHSLCPEAGLTHNGAMVEPHRARPRKCVLAKLRSYAAALSSAQGLVCAGCGLVAQDEILLVNHLHSQTACPIFRRLRECEDLCCSACSVRFDSRAQLRGHLNWASPCLGLEMGTARSCDDCGLTLWSAGLLERHRQSRFGCALVKSGELRRGFDWRARRAQRLQAAAKESACNTKGKEAPHKHETPIASRVKRSFQTVEPENTRDAIVKPTSGTLTVRSSSINPHMQPEGMTPKSPPDTEKPPLDTASQQLKSHFDQAPEHKLLQYLRELSSDASAGCEACGLDGSCEVSLLLAHLSSAPCAGRRSALSRYR